MPVPKGFSSTNTGDSMANVKIDDFLLDFEGSDISIRVQTKDDQKDFHVPGHSFVIRRGSKVFKKMLELDKTKPLDLQIIGDVNDGMRFIRYLYTKTLPSLDMDSYIPVLQTARSYEVTELIELCEKCIRDTVTPYSVCKVYMALEELASEDLLKFLEDLMLNSAFLIFENKLHVSLNELTLMRLLSSDDLNVLNERQAMDALWSWTRTRSFLENKRDAEFMVMKIAKLLPLIRRSFIKDANENDKWFHFMDKGDVHGAKDHTRRPNPCSSLIRVSTFVKLHEIKSGYVIGHDDLSERHACLNFSVHRLIFLTGLTFKIRCTIREYGCIDIDGKHNIVVSVKNNESYKVLQKAEILFGNNGPRQPGTINHNNASAPDTYCLNGFVLQSTNSAVKLRGDQYETSNILPLSIQVDFYTPVPLKPNNSNTITIEVCKNIPYVGQGNFHKNCEPLLYPISKSTSSDSCRLPTTTLVDSHPVFAVHSEMSAIEKIYYLVK